jgi:hypothetical protein
VAAVVAVALAVVLVVLTRGGDEGPMRGDVGSIEPALADREDVLWFGGFEAPDWRDTFGTTLESAEEGPQILDGEEALDGRSARITHEANSFEGYTWYSGFGSDGLRIGTQDDVYLRYYLKPWEDYYFRREAKIPGLGGGNLPSGCDPPDPSAGWSGRLQWGQVENHTRARIQTYLYTAAPDSNTGGCGFKEDWDEGAELTPGEWSCIEIRYRMNTPGEADGVMQGWFDGELRYEREDILFRDTPELGTDTLMGTFFHGGEVAWQPIKDEYIWIDNMVLATDRIGCREA